MQIWISNKSRKGGGKERAKTGRGTRMCLVSFHQRRLNLVLPLRVIRSHVEPIKRKQVFSGFRSASTIKDDFRLIFVGLMSLVTKTNKISFR